jgi:hypothetical protein
MSVAQQLERLRRIRRDTLLLNSLSLNSLLLNSLLLNTVLLNTLSAEHPVY